MVGNPRVAVHPCRAAELFRLAGRWSRHAAVSPHGASLPNLQRGDGVAACRIHSSLHSVVRYSLPESGTWNNSHRQSIERSIWLRDGVTSYREGVERRRDHSMIDSVLAGAQFGDSDAFAELTDRYRRELHVHGYRILG